MYIIHNSIPQFPTHLKELQERESSCCFTSSFDQVDSQCSGNIMGSHRRSAESRSSAWKSRVREVILKNCGTCVLIPFLPQVSVDWATGSGVLMKPDLKLLSWKWNIDIALTKITQIRSDYVQIKLMSNCPLKHTLPIKNTEKSLPLTKIASSTNAK